MSLPVQYFSVEEYFQDAIQFLKSHQWMYNFPNTHIRKNKCLDHIMDEWIEYSRSLSKDQIRSLSTGIIADDCPNTLRCLLLKIIVLKHFDPLARMTNVVIEKRNNVNPKKAHEIEAFATFINRSTTKRNVKYFLDIGAGLGYLPQYLFERHRFKVLGIEGSEEKVQRAVALQQQSYPESKDFVKYKQIFVTQDSTLQLFDSLIDAFPEFNPEIDSFGIIGLHACADLGMNMLHFFKNISSACCLLLMPCCYHRIEMKENNECDTQLKECFMNFPLSNVLKELFVQFDATTFLRRPFLRLAAQQADSSWIKLSDKEMKVAMENCLFRAILQEVCETEHLRMSRNKRKTGCKTTFKIHAAIDDVARKFSFRHVDETSSPVCMETLKVRLLNSWLACHERDLPAIELYCIFQNVLQELCENVVLLDRVQHMRELGFVSCKATKITNKHISPRCHAIVAFK